MQLSRNRTQQQRKSDRRVQFHDLQDGTEQEPSDSNDDTFHDSVTDLSNDDTTKDDNTILANMTQRKPLPPGYLQRLLSSSNKASDNSVVTPPKFKEVIIDGKRFHEVNTENILYCHSHDREK